MKKSILFVAALALTFAACQPNYDVEDKTVATFEEAAITPAQTESVYHLGQTGTFTSGNFVFTQEVSVSEWGTYYFGNVVSNKTGNTYKDDMDGDKSVKGGARNGRTSSYGLHPTAEQTVSNSNKQPKCLACMSAIPCMLMLR